MYGTEQLQPKHSHVPRPSHCSDDPGYMEGRESGGGGGGRRMLLVQYQLLYDLPSMQPIITSCSE